MALVPPWVRIYRIQRDIPMPLVSSGVEKGNLRELALARMGHLGLQCRDVRTREAGIQDIHHQVPSPPPPSTPDVPDNIFRDLNGMMRIPWLSSECLVPSVGLP